MRDKTRTRIRKVYDENIEYYTIPIWKKKIRKKRVKNFFRISGITIVITFLVGSFTIILGTVIMINAFSQDLPNLDKYLAEQSKEGKESIIVDRNGEEIYRIRGEAIKEKVTIDEVPNYLKWAFVAAEDKEFYDHTGLNMIGLSRAIICHATDSESTKNCGGGSSITQQLIKNVTSDNERTFQRKVREAVQARDIEQDMTKDEILEFYMNVVPEGGIIYGVKSGATYLFGKDNLEDLTLAEMAYLAGIPNQPSVFSPWGGDLYSPQQGQDRAVYVLERMREIKDKIGITDEEIDVAITDVREENVKFKANDVGKKAPHYVDYVLQELNEMYANEATDQKEGYRFLDDKGYTITTAVDLEVQEMLEDHLKTTVPTEEYQAKVNSENAAAVLMDPRTGELIAMVGSKDYSGEKTDKFSPIFNAALSPRSMGSTMKPPLYLSLFREGYHQQSRLFDYGGINMETNDSAPEYFPQNYSRTFGQFGNLPTVMTSLNYSLNVPAIATYNIVGKEGYIDTYKKLNDWDGVEEQILGAAAPLGAANMPLIEQVHAYSTFASEGVYRPKKSILEITDSEGNVIYQDRDSDGRQVIEQKYVHMINEVNENYWIFNADDVLVDLKKTMDIAGKTGTSDNSEGKPGDAVFISYTPTFVLGMWAGNSCGADACPLEGQYSTGEDLYNTMYKSFLQKYRDKIEPAKFSESAPGLIEVNICPDSGMLHTDACPSAPQKIKVADTSAPTEENMYEKELYAQCDGETKLVRKEDEPYIDDVKEKVFFTYKYPIERIENEVNSRIGQAPPEEYCEVDPSQKDDDDENLNEQNPRIVLESPTNGESFYKDEEVEVLIKKTESSGNLLNLEIVFNNIIVKTFSLDGDEYEYVLDLESASIGSNDLKIIATGVNGEIQEKTARILVEERPQSPTDTPTITTTPTTTPTFTLTPSPTPTGDPNIPDEEESDGSADAPPF